MVSTMSPSLIMLRGYTFKLYPNVQQSLLLDKHFGSTRWVYNEMIRINQKSYRRRGKSLSGFDMQSYLPKLKKQYPWLSEVNSQALQIVCHNLADAYGKFFKKQGGYPRFKKKGESDSFTCVNNSRIEGNKLRLPKLGTIRFRAGDRPEGKIKRFTIRKMASGYYGSALIETPEVSLDSVDPKAILGIDLGLTDIIVTSAGEKMKAPKYFKNAQAKLRLRQQALSRKQKGSNRRGKARVAVARLHEKIRNSRKDFNHKVSRRLVADSENQAFATENLNVKGMLRNHKLAKHIADCGWRQFLTFLKYKAEAVGKQVIEVDRFYPSSKTCSDCGVVRQSLPLSIREWQCGDCGALHHRDINAAINIALEASRSGVFDRRDSGRPVVLRRAAVNEASTYAVG